MLVILFGAISVFAQASGDICESPFEGGVGDPLFCRVEPDVRLETPYFSIDTHPRYLVGVDSDGERLFMQETPLKEQASLRVLVVEPTSIEAQPNRWRSCSEFELNGAIGLICDRSANEEVRREYFLQRGDVALIVNLVASPLAQSSLPGLVQIFESLTVGGN
jgi:hypothetical protein